MATIYKPGDKDNTRQRTPVQARQVLARGSMRRIFE